MTYTLKQWRMLKGMSRKALAEKIGKTEVTIWSWENERTYPTTKDVGALKQALMLDTEDSILLPVK